ncbi:TetR/AcrR family transcriptional regulator [Sphingomonas gilva]|uniref:TetR/AcrR family transcriptional regulator n=1 Tax=Sphingomonas gilva TaxID=2305907 RepID=A0A396RN76_9SPHN|nr:TetR/AcrR family transcriptional regulator [Sphingomonas gilva]RHW17900.1 TetR/AcrR family transcriptional regulator [Sphingomonas gilva]
MTGITDPRAQRTRQAILDTFVHLVFERRYDAIRTADIIAAADIGRATFYEHFPGKEAVLIEVMTPILLPIANAAVGRAGPAMVRATLEHVWERRAVGRAILGGAPANRLQRRLAAMIALRLPDDAGGAPKDLVAGAIAAAQLAMLRMWIGGEVSCPADILAERIAACGRLGVGGTLLKIDARTAITRMGSS